MMLTHSITRGCNSCLSWGYTSLQAGTAFALAFLLYLNPYENAFAYCGFPASYVSNNNTIAQTPTSVLKLYPDGGKGLEGETQGIALQEAAAAEFIVRMSSGANALQSASIGNALGIAYAACLGRDLPRAQRIVLIVRRSQNPIITKAFNAVQQDYAPPPTLESGDAQYKKPNSSLMPNLKLGAGKIPDPFALQNLVRNLSR